MTADGASPGTMWPKAAGWDAVGLEFWRRGRATAKPSAACVAWFCADLARGDRCLVVGGTTVDVIRHAAAAGLGVTVLDFSARVCREVGAVVADDVAIVHGNVLTPPAIGPFDRVTGDTLLNRFDGIEAARFADAVAGLLRPGGQLRMTVKLGRYPMDERLLDLGRAAGTLDEFLDVATNTIDFSRTGDLLEHALVAHGTLSREEMLTWYRMRGREKRYERSDLLALFAAPRWHVRLATDDDRPDCCRLEATLQPHAG